jgi:hypothetical protein
VRAALRVLTILGILPHPRPSRVKVPSVADLRLLKNSAGEED